VTDENGTPYLIAFTCNKEGKHNVDRMLISRITFDTAGKPQLTLVKKLDETRKMFANHGTIPGLYGVHFRWGTGIYVTPQKQLEIVATGRNILPGKCLEANIWK